jgi:hypothetical protein
MINDLKFFGIKFTKQELKLINNHLKKVNKRIPIIDRDSITLSIIENNYSIRELSTFTVYKKVYGDILSQTIKNLLYSVFKNDERLAKGLFQIGPFNKWYRKLDVHNLCVTDNSIYFPKQFESLLTKTSNYEEFIDAMIDDYLISVDL